MTTIQVQAVLDNYMLIGILRTLHQLSFFMLTSLAGIYAFINSIPNVRKLSYGVRFA